MLVKANSRTDEDVHKRTEHGGQVPKRKEDDNFVGEDGGFAAGSKNWWRGSCVLTWEM